MTETGVVLLGNCHLQLQKITRLLQDLSVMHRRFRESAWRCSILPGRADVRASLPFTVGNNDASESASSCFDI